MDFEILTKQMDEAIAKANRAKDNPALLDDLVITLNSNLKTLKAAEEEYFGRYEPYTTKGRAKVFKLKKEYLGDRFICPVCKDNGRDSPLEPTDNKETFERSCKSCGIKYNFNPIKSEISPFGAIILEDE